MATYEIQVGEDRWRVDVPDEVEDDEATLNTFLTQTAASLENGEGYGLGEAPEEEKSTPETKRPFQKAMDDLLETVGTMGMGVAGSAAGGLATGTRLIENAFRGGFEEEEGAGKYFWEDELDDAVAHGQAVQNEVSYQPTRQGTKDNLQALNDSIVGDAGRMYDSATDKLSGMALEATNSPVAAGLAKGAPDLALEILGLGTARRGTQAASKHLNRPDMQQLNELGVEPTVGQYLGGPFKAVEDRLAGAVPGVRGAQNRVMEEWQNGVINQSMRPLGVKVEGTGAEAIEQAQRALDEAYDSARAVLPDMEVKGTDLADNIGYEMEAIKNRGLEPGTMDSVNNIYETKIKPILEKDKVGTDYLQRVESDLSKIIADASAEGNLPLATSVRRLLHTLREQAASQSKEYGKRTARANAAYSMFADIELAAAKPGEIAGTFTPAQLQAASKQGKGRRAKARGGDGVIADQANAARRSISQNRGSDTVEKGGIIPWVLGASLDPLTTAAVAAGGFAGSTRPGQALGRMTAGGAFKGLPAAGGAGMFGVPLIAAGNDERE